MTYICFGKVSLPKWPFSLKTPWSQSWFCSLKYLQCVYFLHHSLISGIIFSLPMTVNVNLATWFKRCAKESLLIHPFVYSFVHSTNICCSRHQRYSVEQIRQRTCSPKLFSRVLTKRQTLVRRLPLWALMLLVPLYFPSEKLFTPSQRTHASYIMVNKFYMCQMPPHSPNSHSLPCRLLQEGLEKNVNGHIFLSK